MPHSIAWHPTLNTRNAKRTLPTLQVAADRELNFERSFLIAVRAYC